MPTLFLTCQLQGITHKAGMVSACLEFPGQQCTGGGRSEPHTPATWLERPGKSPLGPCPSLQTEQHTVRSQLCSADMTIYKIIFLKDYTPVSKIRRQISPNATAGVIKDGTLQTAELNYAWHFRRNFISESLPLNVKNILPFSLGPRDWPKKKTRRLLDRGPAVRVIPHRPLSHDH